MKNEWRLLGMDELYDLLVINQSSVFHKPTFPTRRWGKIHLKFSTTDIDAINKGVEKLKEKKVKCRKRIDYETMKKFPKWGKFYKIEVIDYNIRK